MMAKLQSIVWSCIAQRVRARRGPSRVVFAPLLLLSVVACSMEPPAAEVRPVLPAPQMMLAQIRAAGAEAPHSLEVQPLRDPGVADLRVRAVKLETQADYAGATQAIAQALAIQPDDPELLQQSAEFALFRGDWQQAGDFARQSFDRGPRVGSLCRRNWATLRFVGMAHADAIATQAAVAGLAACTVEPPARY